MASNRRRATDSLDLMSLGVSTLEAVHIEVRVLIHTATKITY